LENASEIVAKKHLKTIVKHTLPLDKTVATHV
jgi:hypothetical protein